MSTFYGTWLGGKMVMDGCHLSWSTFYGTGIGSSKKEAQKNAAKDALEKLAGNE